MYQIMIVDDESLVRKGIIESINIDNMGIKTVYEASGGMEALEMMDANHIDLIITDIKMPEMDGITFIQEIRKRNKDIPVIVVSGYSDFLYLQSAIRYGVNDYILKPIRELELNAILETAMEQVEKSSIPFSQKMILRETVLYRMLSGKIGKLEAKEKLEGLGIAFRRGKYQAAVLKLKEQHTIGIMYQIAVLADKILSRNQSGAAFVYSDREIVMIFCGIRDMQHCDNLKKEIQEKAEEKYQFTSVLLSGELVDEVEELPYSYASACKKTEGPIASEEKDYSKLIKDVLDYIEVHYTENLTLKNLGERFYVNSSYLGYLFKKERGLLFNDYVNQCRISYVSDLLENTSLRIYEIMEKAGIRDAHYFARMFKKYKGMTPTEYRNKKEHSRKLS